MNKKKIKKAGIITVIVFGLAVCVFLRLTKPKKEIVTRELPTVTTTTLKRGVIINEESLIGTVNPSDTYKISPKVSGEILEICVVNGQHVKKGDPIARIDNQKAIDAAKATMDAAKASANSASHAADTARDALNRMTPLFQAGDIAAQTYQSTVNSAGAAASQAEAAAAQARSAELNYNTQVEYATVTASADGIIQNTDMRVNAMVSPSTELCILVSEGRKTVRVNVTENVLVNQELGGKIVVEKNGSTYEGTITKIGTVLNTATGLFPIEAELEKAEGLENGASAKVKIVAEHAENALMLPVDYVFYRTGDPYVFVRNGDAVDRIFIKIGVSNQDYYEVLEGLDENMEIVSSWTDELYPGAKVNIKE